MPTLVSEGLLRVILNKNFQNTCVCKLLRAFICSGTVDNLTATSSPLQITLDDPTPGQRAEVIAANKKAYRCVSLSVSWLVLLL